MILSDSHTHCDFSFDSRVPMEEMVNSALQKGLKYYTTTDHLDYDTPPESPIQTFDIDKYFAKHKEVKNAFSDDISLFVGVEFGLQPHLGNTLNEVARNHAFDFIIGSLHLVDGFDPYFSTDIYTTLGSDGAYDRYLQYTYESIQQADNFDALGHIDYIIRYNNQGERKIEYKKHKEIIDKIFRFLIKNDKALEINSKGYYHGIGNPHPNYALLRRYYDMGGRLITIGSDAHIKKRVADDFDKVEKNLKKIGFKHYYYYKKREPIELSF